MRRLAPLVAALSAIAICAPSAADAALRFERCGGFGYRCATLKVPLDRTGTVPGEVLLHIRRVRARRRPARGATFVLAGGPGQSATAAFAGEGLAAIAPAYRTRDLILFDQRGTGRSGLLRCRSLQRANILDAGRAAAECAERLGPARAFYTTPETVEDIEAIRRELGVPRIALYGTSYGTKVALAYALRYPANVERLALDSIVEPDGPDTLYLDSIQAVPRALTALCRVGCGGFTRDPVADVQALVARLAAGPLRGTVFDARGRGRRVELTRSDLFLILVSGDFDADLRADFPAAVRSALSGDLAPVLRLRQRSIRIESAEGAPRAFSTATYAATTCEEARLPWARTAPFELRRGEAAAQAEALPTEAFGPFDRATALDNDIINLCEFWPAAPTEPAFGTGPPPDVPVLLLEGEDDLRTPLESAQRVAALFPQARLYLARATGHSALGSDFSGCAERAFARFFLGRRMPGPCRPVRRLPKPTRPVPATLRRVRRAPGVPGLRGRAVRAVILTLNDVVDDYASRFLSDAGDSLVTRGGGLRGGHWSVTIDGDIVLDHVRFVSGVGISGRLRRFLEPGQRGRLRVSGPATPDGLLVLRGRRLSGRLGGRRVQVRLAVGAASARASAASAAPRLR